MLEYGVMGGIKRGHTWAASGAFPTYARPIVRCFCMAELRSCWRRSLVTGGGRYGALWGDYGSFWPKYAQAFVDIVLIFCPNI